MQNSPVGSESCIFLNNADFAGLSFSKTPANAWKNISAPKLETDLFISIIFFELFFLYNLLSSNNCFISRSEFVMFSLKSSHF